MLCILLYAPRLLLWVKLLKRSCASGQTDFLKFRSPVCLSVWEAGGEREVCVCVCQCMCVCVEGGRVCGESEGSGRGSGGVGGFNSLQI